MDRQNSQNLNNDTFYRPPVKSASVLIGRERYPDNSLLLNYDDNDYYQCYGQIKEAFNLNMKDITMKFMLDLMILAGEQNCL